MSNAYIRSMAAQPAPPPHQDGRIARGLTTERLTKMWDFIHQNQQVYTSKTLRRNQRKCKKKLINPYWHLLYSGFFLETSMSKKNTLNLDFRLLHYQLGKPIKGVKTAIVHKGFELWLQPLMQVCCDLLNCGKLQTYVAAIVVMMQLWWFLKPIYYSCKNCNLKSFSLFIEKHKPSKEI